MSVLVLCGCFVFSLNACNCDYSLDRSPFLIILIDRCAMCSWKYEECVGDIRPHPLSEFPVLPLHDNDEDDDPSSILIWGGYAEPTGGGEAEYGDEADEFKLPYSIASDFSGLMCRPMFGNRLFPRHQSCPKRWLSWQRCNVAMVFAMY